MSVAYGEIHQQGNLCYDAVTQLAFDRASREWRVHTYLGQKWTQEETRQRIWHGSFL
jgi:hypothetical protein